MKRKVVYYTVFAVEAALCAAGAAVAFVENVVYAGVLCLIAMAIGIFELALLVAQDNLNIKCGKLCEAKEYEQERSLIEKKMKSPFFFLIRTVALTRYIRVCMALDDLPTAKRYIETLRHGGGAGWKYKTAFFYILIALDEGNTEQAYAEYREFRTDCANAKIYAEDIEVLSAIFPRIYRTADIGPLPQAAVQSPFPVLGRVLGRALEERAAADGDVWEE